jgi:hypothetical protein
MTAEYIYGFGKLNRTNNNNYNNNTKQGRSKKNSKGKEVHPLDKVEQQVPESSIHEVPIGFPVDKEKLKDLKKKLKNEDEKKDNENVSIQEDTN